MIADADTAEVDTSLIPHPLVLLVAIVNLAAGTLLLHPSALLCAPLPRTFSY